MQWGDGRVGRRRVYDKEQSVDFARIENYFVQMLHHLDRMATVMERFENALNPTFAAAEEDLRDIIPVRLAGEEFAPLEFPGTPTR